MTEWKGVCHRCGAKSDVHIMSMYNEQLICMECKDKETKRDDYDKAVRADHEQIRQGNYNFKGIGFKGVPSERDERVPDAEGSLHGGELRLQGSVIH